MNKINRFLFLYMIVITTLCIYMCYIAFYEDKADTRLVDQVQSTIVKNKTKQEVEKKKAKTTFQLAIRNQELVVIQTGTKEIFEYTDLKENHLPVEVRKMLKKKTLFYSPEDVYHFLESYSS